MPGGIHEGVDLRPLGGRNHVRVGQVLLRYVRVRRKHLVDPLAQPSQQVTGKAIAGDDVSLLLIVFELVVLEHLRHGFNSEGLGLF